MMDAVLRRRHDGRHALNQLPPVARAVVASGFSQERLYRALETKLPRGVRITPVGLEFDDEFERERLSIQEWADGLKVPRGLAPPG